MLCLPMMPRLYLTQAMPSLPIDSAADVLGEDPVLKTWRSTAFASKNPSAKTLVHYQVDA